MFDKQSNVNAHTAPAADRKLAADRHNYAKKSTIVATKLTVRYTHIVNNQNNKRFNTTRTHRWSSRKLSPQNRNTDTYQPLTVRHARRIRTIGLPVEVKLLLGDATVADLADPHQLAHLIVIYSSVFSGAKVGD
jgi:hypothetical protein